jgi:methionyl-tRNA formyltransferase
MNFIFVGYNPNGEKCLAALLGAGFRPLEVVAPAGYDTEGIRVLSGLHELPYRETNSLSRASGALHAIDLVVVASYPKLFPPEFVSAPRIGVVNVHTSALPRLRGVHPLNWALIRDERTVGVTVHFIDEGMDSGDIIAQEVFEVDIEDDINSILEKTTDAGARLLLRAVSEIERGQVVRSAQNHAGATFAPRRTPEDGRIDWADSSRQIFSLARALYTPYPRAFSDGPMGRVHVEKVFVSSVPGTVLAKVCPYCYVIATGDGTIYAQLDRDDIRVGAMLSLSRE